MMTFCYNNRYLRKISAKELTEQDPAQAGFCDIMKLVDLRIYIMIL